MFQPNETQASGSDDRSPSGARDKEATPADEPALDEEAVRSLLAGSDADIDRAVALIHEHLRRPLTHWLHDRLPSLSNEDLADAWAEAMLGVLRAARQRRFRPDEPLFPWLCTIVRGRGIDLARRRSVRDATRAPVRAEACGAAARGRSVPTQAGEGELAALLCRAIDAFPDRQRAVLRAFVECYPDTANRSVLLREASRLAGAPLTPASVKRALEEGRGKLRALLVCKGYVPGEPAA